MTKRHILLAVSLLLCVASVTAVGALAWADNYVTTVQWGPGSEDNSPFNSDEWVGQVISHSECCGGNPNLGTAYIDSGYSEVNSYEWDNTGYHYDDRHWWGYAAARCRASNGNNYALYVNYCYAQTASG
jgi:hypothetical protein